MPSQATSTDPIINGSTPAPAEVEQTIARLSAHKTVRGVMVCSVGSEDNLTSGIIKHSGAVFEGEKGKKYASFVKRLVDCCRAGPFQDDGDEVRFMRLRTRKHELFITPDDRYILIVLQDPDP